MFDIQVIGLKAVKGTMEKRRKKLANLRHTNAKAVIMIEKWIQGNFKQQGKLAKTGGWKKLSDTTIEMRRKGEKKELGNKILQNTGQLKNNWKHFWNAGGGWVRNDLPYSKTHHFGAKKGSFGTFTVNVKAHTRKGKPVKAHTRQTKLPWGDIPARPILPSDKQIAPELLKIYGKHVKTSIRAK